jgi:hypothetical protein
MKIKKKKIDKKKKSAEIENKFKHKQQNQQKNT